MLSLNNIIIFYSNNCRVYKKHNKLYGNINGYIDYSVRN